MLVEMMPDIRCRGMPLFDKYSSLSSLSLSLSSYQPLQYYTFVNQVMSTLYFVVHDYSIPAQHIREYAGATKDGRDHELRLSVKRYVPKSPQQDSSTSMTILAQGGNGFCKARQRLEETVEWSNVGANGLVQELYEPLWDDFLPRVRASGQDIKAIWTVDLVNQGVSGLLNRDLLGDDRA